MPLFEVTVKGCGIRLAVVDGEAVGFFRLVRVRAEDRPRAETKAIAQVNADWRNDVHASRNKGGALALTIDRTAQLSWWNHFVPRKSGYIFFAKDDDPPAAASE